MFNVKQMAQTYNYLREHGLLDYGELEEKASAATEQFHALSAQIKAAYAEYRRSRDEMRELLLHKQNVDRMLGKNEREEEKKKEHDRQ